MYKRLSIALSNKNLHRLAVLIILIGIVLRIVFYLQNRCLFIDEANVARNIYERNFSQLTLPLHYEQYAPPLFLWIIKLSTILFGYSEFSFRLLLLVCGVAALWLMYLSLNLYSNYTSMWYPLFLFATGFIYIRYSAETKQYMCDVVVVLALLLSALHFDILKTRKSQFFIFWVIAGSVSIWLCMPVIFMLPGIAIYYARNCISQKSYRKLLPLAWIGTAWLLQFVLYYFSILKQQIQSDYLQSCHKDYFLSFPSSFEEVTHDTEILINVLSELGGKWTIPVTFHLIALVAGIRFLYLRDKTKLLLIIMPVLLVITASAMHQYALTPRLVLFIMPLLMIVISAGLQRLFQTKFTAVKILVVTIATICICKFSTFQLLHKRFDNEEITRNLAFLQKEKINGSNLFVRDLAGPAYIYYTTIHPSKEKWQDIAGGQILLWNCNYDSLAQSFTGKNALLYSWAPENEILHEQEIFEKYCHLAATNIVTGGVAFVYEK